MLTKICTNLVSSCKVCHPVDDPSPISNEKSLNGALQAVERMDQQSIPVSREIVYHLLHKCVRQKDLIATRRVHSLMISNGLDSTAVLCDHLIRLFVSCGSLVEANQVFGKVSRPTVYTWNAIILAHAKLGETKRALEMYHTMLEMGIRADKVTFLCVLKACGDTGSIDQGRLVHGQITSSGLESDINIGNTLVDMYAKCRSVGEAQKVFDELSAHDVVSWSVMIAAYALQSEGISALELYEKMQQVGIEPSKVTFFVYIESLWLCRCY